MTHIYLLIIIFSIILLPLLTVNVVEKWKNQ